MSAATIVKSVIIGCCCLDAIGRVALIDAPRGPITRSNAISGIIGNALMIVAILTWL